MGLLQAKWSEQVQVMYTWKRVIGQWCCVEMVLGNGHFLTTGAFGGLVLVVLHTLSLPTPPLPIPLPAYLSPCLSPYLSLSLPINLPTYPSPAYPSPCLSLPLTIPLPVYPSSCLDRQEEGYLPSAAGNIMLHNTRCQSPFLV